MPVRSAIVGTGAIADAHAQGIRDLGDRAEIVGVADLDADRAHAFARRWGIEAVHPGIAELLAATRPDLVHICTPPGSHTTLAEAVLRAGAVPIIEKPPALSLEDFDRLAAVEAETGGQAIALFQQRFGAGAAGLRALVAEQALGRPLVAVCETLWYRDDAYFEVPWRGKWHVEGGGPTMGHGIHQFDLLLSVLGPWRSVRAVAARQARPTETEDVSAAIVTFESGAVATILNSLVSPRETSRLRFDFEHATVELEHLYGYGAEDWRFTPAPGSERLEEDWSSRLIGPPSSHGAQFAAVLAARDAGMPLPVSLVDARRTMELIAAIYSSSFDGSIVNRGDIGPGHPFYSRMQGTGAPWVEVTA